jgi:nucleoside-diphosphate-sugar epimerase
MVTGGTGSFGTTIISHFLALPIAELRVVSRDEMKQDEQRRRFGDRRLKYHIADVRDAPTIEALTRGADYIYHAAALKQVPSCEFHPMEALKTNVLGTSNVIDAAIRTGVRRVVCLSTDKAVYPINAMGMSKALMEKVAIAKARAAESSGTIITLTRYGNVLASSGSVLPLFVDQVRRGEPITITDPRMTRFVMTLDQAVTLCLHAFENGANGELFVQKTPAATIEALAAAVLRIMGREDHPVKVIGTRHGEKQFETLLSREEMSVADDHGDYFRVMPDDRGLNYDAYFKEGEERLSRLEDFNSNNARQLSVDELVELLQRLPLFAAYRQRAPTITSRPRTVAVTGAAGFIGQNLLVRLREQGFEARPITRDTPAEDARAILGSSDAVFHLAGANRPRDAAEFTRSNLEYAGRIAEAIALGGRRPLVVCSSTARVADNTPYGQSKLAGEAVMLELAERGAATVAVYRLPNVFGKWARPDYNSAVATFCHNLARGLPIRVDDPDAPLSLLYVDDLIDQWLDLLSNPPPSSGIVIPSRIYQTTVGEVADQIRSFAEGRTAGRVEEVGTGLRRALYATFVAALPEQAFSYPLMPHLDHRGAFTEVLKTRASGQVSCLTALPGVTRGGHYHHSKVEKFLVMHGEARFRFRHALTGAVHEIETSGALPVVVEAIPGWAHDITNIGDELLVALLWANEVFEPERPDTVAMPL